MFKKTILSFISFYQNTKWFHGTLAKQFFLTDKVCRFIPTCSQYTYQAIEKYGSIKGLWLGFKRVIHCHPWSKGGFDPVS